MNLYELVAMYLTDWKVCLASRVKFNNLLNGKQWKFSKRTSLCEVANAGHDWTNHTIVQNQEAKNLLLNIVQVITFKKC